MTGAARDSAAEESGGAVDRRRLRTERGRQLVVDALLAYYDEGDPEPGAAKIAARAGVSERTVFRYFDDLDSLAAAAIESQVARVGPIFAAPVAQGALDQRVAALVTQRARIYDATAVATRAAWRFAAQSDTITQALTFRRGLLRDQLAELFAPELTALPSRLRTETLDALDSVASLETMDQLRAVAGHPARRAENIVTRLLLALLAH